MFSFGSSDVLRRCLSSEMKRRANIFSTRSDSEDVFVSRAATVLLLRKQLSTETEGAGKEMAARKLKPLKTREKEKLWADVGIIFLRLEGAGEGGEQAQILKNCPGCAMSNFLTPLSPGWPPPLT